MARRLRQTVEVAAVQPHRVRQRPQMHRVHVRSKRRALRRPLAAAAVATRAIPPPQCSHPTGSPNTIVSSPRSIRNGPQQAVFPGALRDCDLFVAIGTSGTVVPAALFVRWAAYAGARRVLLNLEIDDAARADFSECYAGKADDLVERWFA